MAKRIFQNYTFTPATRQITFVDYATIDKKKILGITNSTQNRVIYNPNSPGLGGTVSGNVLTLAFDTTTHGNNDDLIVAYENGTERTAVLTSAISEVSYLNVNSGGAGYTSIPTVAFVGNTSTVQPTAVAVISNGSVIGIRITNPGVSTVAPTSATLTGGGFTTAATLSTPTSGQSNRQYVDGEATAYLQYFGTWSAINSFEASVDGLNYFAVNGVIATNGVITNNMASNLNVRIDVAGLKYIQVRVSSYTSGQVITNLKLSSTTSGVSLENPLPQGNNSIGGVAINSAGAGLGFALQSSTNTDVASAAITTTTTSATITQGNVQSASFNVAVSAVSGTTPTLDISIEESDDGGTSWYPIFQMARITAAGIYRTPVIMLSGNRIRYVQTVGGTTPSFTRAISRNNFMHKANNLKVFVDRTVNPNTVSSTTPAYFVGGSDAIGIYINMGAATTTPTFQLQGSEDNLNWYAIGGSTLATTANATVYQYNANTATKFVRAIVATAGTSATLGYVEIKAIGR